MVQNEAKHPALPSVRTVLSHVVIGGTPPDFQPFAPHNSAHRLAERAGAARKCGTMEGWRAQMIGNCVPIFRLMPRFSRIAVMGSAGIQWVIRSAMIRGRVSGLGPRLSQSGPTR